MASRKRVRIALVQMAVSDDPHRNMAWAAARVEDAAALGAKIVCLPELYRAPYFPREKNADVRLLAEPVPGESTLLFSRIAREQEVVVIVPIFEQAGKKFYNSAIVIDDRGRLLPAYRKLHLPQDPCFWEQDYFSPGDRGYHVYRTEHADFGVLICFDQWFPEAARALVLSGADLIFYPTAIGWMTPSRPRKSRGPGERSESADERASSPDGDWHDSWETVMRGHSVANGVHVAAVNRVGEEGKLRFWGQSFVTDAFGHVEKRASEDKEEILVADLDFSMNERIRDGWGFLRERRPDTYGTLTKKKRKPRRR